MEGKSPAQPDDQTTQQMNSAPSASRLLTLPPEIRNTIYHYRLSSNSTIALRSSLHGGKKCPEPSLLRTCHQIRSEATAVYYANNSFLFSFTVLNGTFVDAQNVKSFVRWLDATPARYLDLIPELFLNLGGMCRCEQLGRSRPGSYTYGEQTVHCAV